jgi:hypothetical protein
MLPAPISYRKKLIILDVASKTITVLSSKSNFLSKVIKRHATLGLGGSTLVVILLTLYLESVSPQMLAKQSIRKRTRRSLLKKT